MVHGYTKRFAIHHTDFRSLSDAPKLSAAFYRETVAQNRVVQLLAVPSAGLVVSAVNL